MIIVTGATGFCGSRLTARLAAAGEAVAAVVRAPSEAAAQARLTAQLAAVAASDGTAGDGTARDEMAGERPAPAALAVTGDVGLPLLGLAPQALERFGRRGVGEVWHAAASLRFTDPSDEALVEENVGGTRNALDLAASLGAGRFFYVSTAYSAGRREGPAPEALHDPAGPFRNAYERSKCLSEHLVAETCARRGMEFRILRPGIVVGPARTFASGGSRFGLYAVLEMLRRAAPGATAARPEPRRRPLRLPYDPGATMNFVPVDWLADSMAASRRLDGGARVLHLTTRRPTPVTAVLEAFAAQAGIPVPEPAALVPADATPAERRLHAQLSRFLPYLRARQDFASSAFNGPDLSTGAIEAYVAAFLAEAADPGGRPRAGPAAGAPRAQAAGFA
jgi:nucleoside-diphosphate-sugar epimerase